MAGAIEASITPENADPDVQFADDAEFDVLYPDPELTFNTKMADIPLSIQEMIFGNQIDDNGVLIRKATDKPPYFAVGVKPPTSEDEGFQGLSPRIAFPPFSLNSVSDCLCSQSRIQVT